MRPLWGRTACRLLYFDFAIFTTPTGLCPVGVQAKNAYIEGMKKKRIQYTIRDVPGRVDEALRSYAAEAGTSINQAAVDAIAKGLGVPISGKQYDDLDHLVGSWQEDPQFDEAVAEMDRIDSEMWE